LGISITTADFDRKSICNEKLAEAKDIIAGYNLDMSFLPVVYETVNSQNWEDPEVWKAANPGYGISLQPAYIKQMYNKAKQNPDFENTFKRLHLNLKTEQSRRWLQMAYWSACTTTGTERLQDETCYGGLDLADTEDIASFVLYFPNRNHYFKPWFWIPADHPKCKKEPYLSWIKNGFLLTTPGNQIDYNFIRVQINEAKDLYNLVDVGFDAYNATHIAMQLQEEDGIMITKFPQTFAGMNEPCKRFSSMIKKQEFSHNDHPVFSWMASNVAIREDAYGNIRPDKPGSPQKIDGIVAALMALGRFMFSEPIDVESKYESEELMIL
jgi:phage terminase large subunit-like protein